MPLAGLTAPAARALVDQRVMPVCNVRDPRFGGKVDGTHDDTAAVNAALAAAHAAGGGDVVFPSGTCLCLGDVTIPTFTGGGVLRQKPLRLTGAGGSASFGFAISGGSTLLLRGTGNAGGKLQGLGHGSLEIDHLTLQDDSGGTLPLVYVTNAVLHLHHCRLTGSQTGGACNQDAVVLGGTGTTDDGTADAPFAGYGTVVEQNECQGLRRLAYLRRFANGVVVRANAVASNCGSNLAGGACVEIDGQGTPDDAHGNVVEANTVEVANYAYGFKGANGHANVLAFNGWHDAGAGTLASLRFEASLTDTLVLPGVANDPTTPMVSDASGGAYTLLTGHAGQASVLANPLAVGTAAPPPIDGATPTAVPLTVAAIAHAVAARFWRADAAGNIGIEFGSQTPYESLWQVIIDATNNNALTIKDVQGSRVALYFLRTGSGSSVGVGPTLPTSILTVAGAIATPVATKTAAYTLTAADSVLLGDATGGAFAVTLPTAVGIAGRRYTAKKIDASANALTLATTAAQTIDGAASVALSARWASVAVVSDGANWVEV